MIKVAELFYSIQGEGLTIGRPSIFLRLSGCNLYCKGSWTCDTINIWNKGISYSTHALKKRLENKIYVNARKNTGLVITGGEPLLMQNKLYELISLLNNKIFIEVETNGTIIPDILSDKVDLFNVSPKLPNSGNPESKFYNIEALDYLTKNTEMIFKFVISSKADIKDVHKYYLKYIREIGIHRVYLMPACETREEYYKTAPITAELCKKYGYNFSDRLQINIYNKKTGV